MRTGDNEAQEIIIIKRNRNGEDGHHGGAWKIAFADFMTAMMALFLVLWLVNAANEETKKAVASYFNPVKLVERAPSERGLEEQKGGPDSSVGGGVNPDKQSAKDAETRQAAEKDFFSDPFSALARITAVSPDGKDVLAQGPGGGPESEHPSSPFSDPFGPNFAGKTEMMEELTPPRSQPFDQVVAGNGAQAHREISQADTKTDMAVEKATSTDGARAQADTARAAAGKVDQERSAETRARMLEAISEDLQVDLAKAFGAKKELPELINKAVDVKAVEDGVLISLTDQLGYPMFEIGSAVPLKQAVLAMDSVAKMLAEHKGRLRIYGHTDARAFSTPNDDNWRLSAARAHAAYFMLVRGGVGKERFAQIAGFADQQLKDPEHPNADLNRRIEILLEVE
ncbi:MAG: MotB family protein [Notoacmeibacter sp.]|nr:MotB family protein [Notoacmeibacter sp.]